MENIAVNAPFIPYKKQPNNKQQNTTTPQQVKGNIKSKTIDQNKDNYMDYTVC